MVPECWAHALTLDPQNPQLYSCLGRNCLFDEVETRELCAFLDVGHRDLGARRRVYSQDSRICRYVSVYLISDEHMFVIVGLVDTHD